MATEYTVIVSKPQHFGTQVGKFNNTEPLPEFVGQKKNYSFPCPNVNPGKTAVLMFQSLAVDTQRNVFQVNGLDVSGRTPSNLDHDIWIGNILLLDRHRLKPTNNVLRVESRNIAGGEGGNIDDFILDNVVIMYKTL